MKKQNEWSWRFLAAAAAVAVSAWAGLAQAAPAVENIAASVQGGSEVVRVDFSEPLTSVPTGFAIQSPARIALDLHEARPGEAGQLDGQLERRRHLARFGQHFAGRARPQPCAQGGQSGPVAGMLNGQAHVGRLIRRESPAGKLRQLPRSRVVVLRQPLLQQGERWSVPDG